MLLDLFNLLIGRYQVLPLWAWVNLGAMAMKGYTTFSKAPGLPEPYHQIVLCHIRTLVRGGSYSSAEVQSVYSTAPSDWVMCMCMCICVCLSIWKLINNDTVQIYNFLNSSQQSESNTTSVLKQSTAAFDSFYSLVIHYLWWMDRFVPFSTVLAWKETQ